MEDTFSTDQGEQGGLGMVQAHDTQAHLLLCSAVPNTHRPIPVCRPEAGNPGDKVW